MNGVISDILRFSPTIRYFLVGCEEAIVPEIRRASSHLPRSQRRSFARRRLLNWRQRVEEIVTAARRESFENIVMRVAELPFGGLACADTTAQAEQIIDDFWSRTPKDRCSFHIYEQILSPDLAAIWMYHDGP